MQYSRRQALQALAALACLGLARKSGAQEQASVPRRLFGLQTYSYSLRQRYEAGFDDPLALIAFAGRQGFAGIQLRLGNRTADYLAQVWAAATKLNMFLEGIVAPPLEEKDSERFETEVRAARAANIDVVRLALLSGRRYEVFHSEEEFRSFEGRSWNALQRVARLAGRHKVCVAVENHKDFRARALAQMLRRLDSEFVGVCLDTGNNIALLEDPWHVVDTLAPLTFTVHLKDMALESTTNGFLLAEVPLGRGFLDLQRLVARVHQAKPQARFNLEMMTRNPLSIPCLTDDYWRTLAEVPGVDLARMLNLVRLHARPANELPRIDRLERQEQIRREHEHVVQSQEWAARHLFR